MGGNEPRREYLNLKSSVTNKVGTMGPHDTKKFCTLLNNHVQLKLMPTNQNLIITYNRSMKE